MTQFKSDSIPAIGGDSALEESFVQDQVAARRERSYILDAFMKAPWAILPQHLMALNEIVVRHVAGEKLSADEVQTRIHGAARPASNRRVAAVAVLPLFGTIFPRANLMTQMSGATSAELFGKQFDMLLQDPEVSGIIIDVDSPGGQVAGIEELSNQIFDARGQKPVVAVVDHLMASAAYWIGTAADEVVISPSGEAGSIGVFAVHQDVSAALQQQGIKVTLLSAGKYKTEGNPYEPLTEEARSAIMDNVHEYYNSFVNAIARNRGTSPDAVRNGFGEGRVVGARQAVALGMADRVGTLEETIDRMLSNPGQAVGSQANSLALRASASVSVNNPSALDSSDPEHSDFEHEAQRLRDYVQIFK